MTHPFLRLLSYMKPYKSRYLLGTLYTILNKFFDIMPEVLIGVAVDTVVRKEASWLSQLGFESAYDQILVLGGLTLCIWGLESLTEYKFSIIWRNLAQTMQHKLRLDTYSHVQNLDMATFEKKATGEFIAIINDDVNQLERFLEDGISRIILVITAFLGVGSIFFILAPNVALVAMLPIPLILFGTFYFQRELGARYIEVRTKAGILGARLVNNITGIFTIKSFTAEQFELDHIEKQSNDYRKANSHAIALSSAVIPIIRIAILAGFVSTLIYGGYLTLDGSLEIGIFSVLVFLIQRLLWPLTELADLSVLYQRSMASTTRILNLINTPIRIRSEGKKLNQAKGKIDFKDVSFAYEKNNPILKSLSFSIPAGSSAAFVGTTGSGKTTIIKLLLRLYQQKEGQILFDNDDIKNIDLRSLRSHMGVVSQDVFLFHGTIKENIAYAMSEKSDEEIIKAAKLAEAHDFITGLPNGYETIVGERGQKLSGGQKQRISFARALLKNPSILILDEATSAIDNETEMAIQKSMHKIVKGRTTIMIAHRLSTIRQADQIFVLHKGEVIEKGTHDELLKLNKTYANLWNLQIGQL